MCLEVQVGNAQPGRFVTAHPVRWRPTPSPGYLGVGWGFDDKWRQVRDGSAADDFTRCNGLRMSQCGCRLYDDEYDDQDDDDHVEHVGRLTEGGTRGSKHHAGEETEARRERQAPSRALPHQGERKERSLPRPSARRRYAPLGSTRAISRFDGVSPILRTVRVPPLEAVTFREAIPWVATLWGMPRGPVEGATRLGSTRVVRKRWCICPRTPLDGRTPV